LAQPPKAAHSDDIDQAIEHFNASFRHEYRLPSTTSALLREAAGFEEAWSDIPVVRAAGVADASCAVIARRVLSIVPRYAIGLLTADGCVHVLAPDEGDDDSYGYGHVLLVNPLGGRDNWISMSRWFRRYAGKNARRAQLAGLASEERPDKAANLKLLLDAAATHGRAIVLPPDEAFSSERAAEVSFIYDVPVDTLRAWKQRHRSGLAARRPGAPPKNR
jgi:hypothetical protein